MITIRISEKNGRYKLAVKGHAGSVEQGADPVCAGISTLFYTLAQNVKDFENSGMLDGKPTIKPIDGNGYISFRPAKGYEQTALIMLLAIQRGFSLHAFNKPDHVKIQSLVAPIQE